MKGPIGRRKKIECLCKLQTGRLKTASDDRQISHYVRNDGVPLIKAHFQLDRHCLCRGNTFHI